MNEVTRKTRKQVETLARAWFRETAFSLYKGNDASGYGWYMREFGRNAQYIGDNLKDAHAELSQRLAYREEAQV